MYATGDGVINFKQGSGSWGWGSIDITGGTLTVDTWKHIAVVRNAGTLTVYVDGTSIGSASTGNWGGSTGTLRIGTYFGDARAGYFYMDDLRITKGIARYTGNFTPPTTSTRMLMELRLEQVALTKRGLQKRGLTLTALELLASRTVIMSAVLPIQLQVGIPLIFQLL
jgi:hypothetical protein